jgi:hypothetical protein
MNGTKIKVENFTSANGNKIPNQFLITYNFRGDLDYSFDSEIFQSYDTIIARRYCSTGSIALDKNYWDYSRTTGTYRNIFLGETKGETEKKIKSGEYILTDLN